MPESPDQLERLQQRVTELEMLLSHLQQTTSTLDEVIREQQVRLDSLGSSVGRWSDQIRQISEKVQDERDPEQERPPHY